VKRWLVIALTIAAPAEAQRRVDSPSPFWCSAGTCFVRAERCNEFAQMRSDTGRSAPECREQRSATCLDYYDSRDGDTFEICHTAPAACARQRRELQTYNRRIRYRYEEISECVTETYRPPPPPPPVSPEIAARRDFVRSLISVGEVQISDRFHCTRTQCMSSQSECAIYDMSCEEAGFAHCFVDLQAWQLVCWPLESICMMEAAEAQARRHASICLPYAHSDSARAFSDLNPSPSVSPPP
jgi:hypothetical protein